MHRYTWALGFKTTSQAVFLGNREIWPGAGLRVHFRGVERALGLCAKMPAGGFWIQCHDLPYILPDGSAECEPVPNPGEQGTGSHCVSPSTIQYM